MRMPAPSLAPVFRSDNQLRVLATLFLYGGEWPISDLAQHAEVSLSTASREAQRLVSSGLAEVREVGNVRLVRARADLPWRESLLDLLDQTVGPTHHLRAVLEEPQWATIESAHIFGSWARRHAGQPGGAPNDLDVVLVSGERLSPAQVLAFQRELADRIHLPVDAFAVSPGEWEEPGEALRAIQDGPVVTVRRLSDG
jgi:predicted nucleotidyltransferase